MSRFVVNLLCARWLDPRSLGFHATTTLHTSVVKEGSVIDEGQEFPPELWRLIRAEALGSNPAHARKPLTQVAQLFAQLHRDSGDSSVGTAANTCVKKRLACHQGSCHSQRHLYSHQAGGLLQCWCLLTWMHRTKNLTNDTQHITIEYNL